MNKNKENDVSIAINKLWHNFFIDGSVLTNPLFLPHIQNESCAVPNFLKISTVKIEERKVESVVMMKINNSNKLKKYKLISKNEKFDVDFDKNNKKNHNKNNNLEKKNFNFKNNSKF
jgi:hypothetical protein